MTIDNTLLRILNKIKDPSLNLNAEEMGLRASIENHDGQIDLYLTGGFPLSFLETNYKNALLKELEAELPQLSFNIHLSPFIKAHKTQLTGKGLRGVKNTIAVASGKGGVGKSTVTVNLAIALSQMGARVGILDADIYGPSIPMMLGNTEAVEVSGEHYLPIQAQGVQSMSIGYLTDNEQALIWRGPMLAKSLIQMLDLTLWDELDYLFIDLPPGTGDIQLSLVQKIPLTGAIIVTTPQNIATLDAQKAVQMFARTGIDVLGVVENMATHVCSNCGQHEAIFGEGGAAAICAEYQTKLLGQLPLHSRIRSQSDLGSPVALQSQDDLGAAFAKTALIAAIDLAKRPLNYADKFPNIVVE